MTHGQELNRRIQKQGVVWRECHGCGRTWPFPKVDTPEAELREFKCGVCAHALWAKYARAALPKPDSYAATMLAAYMSFIRGCDIANTVEAARATLVERVLKADADVERLRAQLEQTA